MRHNLSRLFAGLHAQLLLLICGVAFLLAAGQTTVDTVSQWQRAKSESLGEAGNLARMLARSIEDRLYLVDPEEYDALISRMMERSDIQAISIVDQDLNILLDGSAATNTTGRFPDSEALLTAVKSGTTESSISGEYAEVAEPLVSGAQTVGAVRVALPRPSLAEIVAAQLVQKLAVLIPVLAVAALLATGLFGQVVKPIRRFSRHASDIADGDIGAEMPVQGAREFREFAVACNNMIARVRQHVDHVYQLAYVDRVTKLPNREYFRSEVTRAIKRAQRKDSRGALLFVDLDGFKKVNDTLGHDQGDKLLSDFANRVTKIIRADDAIAWQAPGDSWEGADSDANRQVLARLGGDEFTIVLSEIRAETDAAQVARRIINSLNTPFHLDGKEVRLGASVGIATFPRNGTTYEDILKSADMAMYLAKEEGKNTFRFYSDELNQRASARLEIEQDLRRAMQQDELELYFQPTLDCRDESVVSLEALIRWNHPEKGMIRPGDFISIAEDSGLIQPLGEWIFRRVCQDLKRFEGQGIELPISVNISTPQFDRPEFAKSLLEIVEHYSVEPGRVEVEITEAMAMNHPARSLDHIRKLKRAGIRVAIDDFGTGYSNMSLLTRLPFDVFKIDRSFVAALSDTADPHARTIVQTIVGMADSLGYQTVAEGVETEAQRDVLNKLGCHYAQGFLFARPMPAAELADWLSRKNSVNSKKLNPGKAAAA